MPSDERVERALEALAVPRAAFRSAAAEAADGARAILAARGAVAGHGAARASGELGAFAAGRIDAERFAALFEHDGDLEPAAALALERAASVLTEVAGLGAAAHHASVAPGGDLHAAAISALARLGRGFGAARVADLARAGRYRAAGHEVWLTAFRPARWNRIERRLAPPLVLELDGAGLRAGGLAELLDGGQKIVLVVRGPAPPAPLVRLVTPGVFVLQCSDPSDLARLAVVDGPAIAALLPETAARFVHDPASGATVAQRLRVSWLPAEEPRAPLGSYSAAQQAEELRQLVDLAAAGRAGAPATPGAAPPAADAAAGLPPADPADRLAAWLIARADLTGIGGNGGGQ
jgi:hypothetical protein